MTFRRSTWSTGGASPEALDLPPVDLVDAHLEAAALVEQLALDRPELERLALVEQLAAELEQLDQVEQLRRDISLSSYGQPRPPRY